MDKFKNRFKFLAQKIHLKSPLEDQLVVGKSKDERFPKCSFVPPLLPGGFHSIGRLKIFNKLTLSTFFASAWNETSRKSTLWLIDTDQSQMFPLCLGFLIFNFCSTNSLFPLVLSVFEMRLHRKVPYYYYE